MANKPLKSKPDPIHDLRVAEQFQRRVLESAVAAVSVMDLDGRLLTVSERGTEITGYSNHELRGRECTFLVVPEDKARIQRLVESVLQNGESYSKLETTIMCKDGARKSVSFDIRPILLDDKIVGAVAAGEDISLTKRAEEELRQREAEMRLLSSRLLDMQDSERRRIARELHDGTAQNLFAINIALSRLIQQSRDEDVRQALKECLDLCEQSREEIRTLSYVLHPPMLDEAGLVSALKWYVPGFSDRTGIKVDLAIGSNVGRMPIDVETDLFRVAQECLANVHRHSGSASAKVRLDRDGERVLLEIRDWGRGMPAEIVSGRPLASSGVGIPGMQERLGQHGGHLEIQSSTKGTVVTASVPLSATQRPQEMGRRE